MIEAYKKFWLNYTNFKGRASRSDYWYVVLANFIIGIIFGILGGSADTTNIFDIIYYMYTLAILVPGLAICVRRLHDINKSGWYYLMILIPLAGPIIVLVYLCKASVNENNQYQ